MNASLENTSSTTLAIEAHTLGRVFKRRERGSGMAQAIKAFFKSTYVEKVANEDISLSIPRGSCVGLVGANGAGKTTFLKMCAGLLHPTSGSVKVLGFTPSERKNAFQRKIGMVMGQKSQLWIDIPAMETFELLAAVYEVPDHIFKPRVAELAKIFQVEKLLTTQVRRLSLGERMKLEIMAALIHNPELLILDEPTIGLDVIARRNIRQFIREYNEIHKTTIILSSHDMTDIQEVCSRLILIANGKLFFDGPLGDFEKRHQNNPKFRQRNVFFRFDLGANLSHELAGKIANQCEAEVVEADSGTVQFRVDVSHLPKLMHLVSQHATPNDMRIEGQSFEALVHEFMSQNPAGR